DVSDGEHRLARLDAGPRVNQALDDGARDGRAQSYDRGVMPPFVVVSARFRNTERPQAVTEVVDFDARRADSPSFTRASTVRAVSPSTVFRLCVTSNSRNPASASA